MDGLFVVPNTKSVVRVDDVPMTIDIGNINSTLRPVVVPLWDLGPHDSSEEEGEDRADHGMLKYSMTSLLRSLYLRYQSGISP